MPAPPGVEVEIETSDGVFVDVTSDVDWGQGLQVRVGRQSQLSAPSTSSLSFTLRNKDARYTPGRQALTDGTVNPMWPWVRPNRRVRYSNAYGLRYAGPIQSWSPTLQGGTLCDVTVDSVDVTSRLSRVTLQPSIVQEVLADGPLGFWPMTDLSGSLSATSETDWPDLQLMRPTQLVSGGYEVVDFGSASGPLGIEGTAAVLTPDSFAEGDALVAETERELLNEYTIELWVLPKTAATVLPAFVLFLCNAIVPFYPGPSTAAVITIDTSGTGRLSCATYSPLIAGTSVGPVGPDLREDGWHHVVMTVSSAGVQRQYVDGEPVGASASSALTGWRPRYVAVGSQFGQLCLDGRVGPVAIYPQALSAGRVATHYAAGRAFYGETPDQRIDRLLGYGGAIAATDLDASDIVLNSYAQGGVDVLTACQDAVNSEAGDAVLYVRAGVITFRGRQFRMPGDPAMTIDTRRHADRSAFAPSSSALALVNIAKVTRRTAAETLETTTRRDSESIDDYGEFSPIAVTSWAHLSSTERPRFVAQSLLARRSQPRYRLDQLAIDLLTAPEDLYAELQDIEIGSRIRVTGADSPATPTAQLDVIVEGWTESASMTAHQVVFDCSAADSPAWAVASDPVYGLAAAYGQSLASAVSGTATTLSIATDPGMPLITTAGGDVPFDIRLGAEVMTVTAVTGASSPQTLTVQRGQRGTHACPQAVDTPMQLDPCPTAVL